MDEDRSILRGNAPTRRFLVLIPRDGNRCVPLAHCYGNERSRRYLPILDRPLQIVFLIATRVLFARLPGNVIYQIVGVSSRWNSKPVFQASTEQQTSLSLPPRHDPFSAIGMESNYFFFLIGLRFVRIKNRVATRESWKQDEFGRKSNSVFALRLNLDSIFASSPLSFPSFLPFIRSLCDKNRKGDES